MKNNLLLVGAIAGVLILGFVITNQNLQNQVSVNEKIKQSTSMTKPVHYHAAFHHYKDGRLQDYSDFKFMSVQPCSLNENEEHDHENVLDQVHLHDGNGEIVHVHADKIAWKHLFASLNIEVDDPVVYVDGLLVEEGVERAIGEYERVLILENTETKLEAMMADVPTVDEIKEAEKISELCSS